jgi:hypothetical protein
MGETELNLTCENCGTAYRLICDDGGYAAEICPFCGELRVDDDMYQEYIDDNLEEEDDDDNSGN